MKNITIDGRDYVATAKPDDCRGAPWIEHDGHGIVSEWTSRDKRAGEWVLSSDRGSKRFYDFAATMKKAREEGWGLGEKALQELTEKLGRAPTQGEITEASVKRDFGYLCAWNGTKRRRKLLTSNMRAVPPFGLMRRLDSCAIKPRWRRACRHCSRHSRRICSPLVLSIRMKGAQNENNI